MNTDIKSVVLSFISKVKKGKVSSYGTIAILSGTTPRVVGFILNGFSENESIKYPWHRIVNRDGFLSASKIGVGERGEKQKKMLEDEGLEFDSFQIKDIEKYWQVFSEYGKK